MLHELLLALSGHPSPLFPPEPPDPALPSPFSPAESALLASLAKLGHTHRQLRALIPTVCSSHPSIICRAVAAAIFSSQLAAFQQRVLDVERRILVRDAGSVYGYQTVPLSGIVAQFDEWTRKMQWLWELMQLMLPPGSKGDASMPKGASYHSGNHITGPRLINKLREDAHTGYPDLAQCALELTTVAETTWLRQLLSWVLYGRLPVFGAEDFFIQPRTPVEESSGHIDAEFVLRSKLLPDFVSAATASSLLFIGRSLNHVRARASELAALSSSKRYSPPEVGLPFTHVSHLSAFSFPITVASFSSAVAAMRVSLSQSTLQQLLPLEKILEILSILREYSLLGRGEFAVALVAAADEHLASRGQPSGALYDEKGSSKLESVVSKNGEVAAVLSRTWTTLLAFNNHDDIADDNLDLARELVRLNISKSSSPPLTFVSRNSKSSDNRPVSEISFNDFLFGTATQLSLHVTPPLDLFLVPSDLEVYSYMHAYLLSIRRGHLHLTGLWKTSPLRREHPSPLGPPISSTSYGAARLAKRRFRSNERAKKMRRIWATVSAASFTLAELGEYLQREVVSGSWESFGAWLQDGIQRPSSSSSASSSTSSSIDANIKVDMRAAAGHEEGDKLSLPPARTDCPTTRTQSHDPELLSQAHTTYLTHLAQNLFLTSRPFLTQLRTFLHHADQIVHLTTRLQHTWTALDLSTDDGIIDAFADHAAEELEFFTQLQQSAAQAARDIGLLVGILRDIDTHRSRGGVGRVGGGVVHRMGEMEALRNTFLPWNGGGVDRLLMKLDFGGLEEDWVQ
ncbi:MAG: hypothetical protein M1829_003512 [Trizodia sp. TS-e1964]|nr:MAG: hypothetical protein M1829_003512 [Trizodia sp. TS-e1964]